MEDCYKMHVIFDVADKISNIANIETNFNYIELFLKSIQSFKDIIG
jgi:hypothetical protein